MQQHLASLLATTLLLVSIHAMSIIYPSNPTYPTARLDWNQRVDAKTPSAIRRDLIPISSVFDLDDIRMSPSLWPTMALSLMSPD